MSDPMQSYETQNEGKRAWHKFLTYVAPIVIIPVIALGIKALTFELFRVEGASMEASLIQDDRLFVEKFGRQHAWITQNDYIPKRFEVVVFNVPDEFKDGVSATQFVKRVIALPGERVVVQNGRTIVFTNNNQQIDVDELLSVELEQDLDANIVVDTVVPSGHVYLIGDNRTASFDSREMGPIPSQNLVGKVTVRLHPLDRFYIL